MNAAFGKSSNKFVSFFSRYPDETVIYPEDSQFEQDTKNIWPVTLPNFKSDLLDLLRKFKNHDERDSSGLQ